MHADEPQEKPPFLAMEIPLVLSGLTYIGAGGLVYFVFGHPDMQHEMPRGIPAMLWLFFALLGILAMGFAAFVRRPHKAVFYIGLVITVLYLPSAYFIFGLPMIYFLLQKRTRAYYQVDI